jgi:acetyl-CoA carboxylase carboxyl transferase alpha subunit
MHYAVRFGLPIVTFVDTPGAYPGLEAEERGQSVAIAESILQMSRLPVPIVTTVIGEGGSGGALAIAASDRVMILEASYYSVISPEGCSTILFKDALAAPRAAAALKMNAPSLLRLGIVDSVVLEPEAGAHTDPVATAENLKTAIVSSLTDLLALSTDDLLAQRYERFRVFGRPGAQPVLPSEVTP